jgi:hexosaminidase
MLDVSRHFYDVATVERFVDLASHYKLNVFHWHLSDDQGWRLEIKRYPRLTSFGSCRSGSEVGKDPSDVEGGRYCGYYTQDQIREVVAYAAKRYVTIVPEIDMPGHSTAAIASYPFLGCTGKPIPVSTTWGGSYPICPTDRAIAFEENVLDELMQLFPGPYIHTGGDEVPFEPWKASRFVTGLMKREGLKTYPQVQSYFENRIERFIESKGRRMVGWDEVLDGGISRNAVIMSWRGTAGGIKAAALGNDAVMTPDGPLYFDAYQGDRNQEPLAIGGLSTPQMVYNYDPLAHIPANQQPHILGVQANIWTEWIGSVPHLFYMALPRELALSEIAWTPQTERDWVAFQTRMGPQYLWLQQQRYNFRLPNPTFSIAGGTLEFDNVVPSVQALSAHTDASSITVSMSDPMPSAALVYTTDGSDPSGRSPRYTQPLQISLTPGQRIVITAAAVLPDGRTSTTTKLIIQRNGASE